MTRLQALSQRLVPTRELEPLLREILRAAADLTHTDKGHIQFVRSDAGGGRVVVHQGLGDRLLQHLEETDAEPIGDRARRTRARVIVEDVAASGALAGTPSLAIVLDDGIRAVQSTPLLSRDGRLLGLLANHYRRPHRPAEHELRYLDLLARMAADFVERCESEAELEANRRELEAELQASQRLHEIGMRMARADDLQGLLDEIVDAAVGITGADMGLLQMADGTALRLAAHRGFEAPFLDFFAAVEGDRGAWGAALATRGRVVVEDVATSALFDPASRAVMLAANARAAQSTPLVGRTGRIHGMLSTHSRTVGHTPGARSLRGLDLLARMATDLIEARAAEQALRDADRRKDEFLATLAHELRNPLAPIRTAVHLLQHPVPENTRAQATQLIDRQVHKMVRLIDDLLDVSRITYGKLTLRREPLVLQTVLNLALESSRPPLEAAGHTLEIRLPQEPLHVEADAVRLAQVFSNLLDNAGKYTPDGGHIWLEVVPDGDDAVCVRVRDTGIGIAPQHLPEVFRIFSQAEVALARSQGGLGIGLSLAQGLVELHGGTIVARSAGVGQGSEFEVRLPRIRPPSTGVAGDASPVPAPSPAPALRILVVDDNRDAALSLSALLGHLGYPVEVAHDGETALQKARSFRPAVVLLDLGIPRLNGYEVCQALRRQPWGREMLILAVTGWGQDEDRRRSAAAGFDRHLVKPVNLDELLQWLSRAPPRRPDEAAARPAP